MKSGYKWTKCIVFTMIKMLYNADSDPCQSQKNCSYACVLDGSVKACICKAGFNLASDGETCLGEFDLLIYFN